VRGSGRMSMGPRPINSEPRPWGNIPWRGPKMDRKEDDQTQPELAYESKIKIFDLLKPEDLESYQEITNKIANGEYQMGLEKVEFSEKTGGWLVLLRWYEQYYQAPKGAQTATEEERPNGQKSSWG